MHYFQFHIGDYKSHTHHLSVIEDIAYRRLLDHYYLHESPLKQRDIARQIGMRDYEQEVLSVLDEFFVSSDVGFVNPRADEEISKYRQMVDGGKRGAAKRWSSPGDAPPIPLPNAIPIATMNHEPLTNNHSIAQSAKDERFEAFWKAYPKKVGKDAAKKSFKVRKVDDSLLTEMMSALSKQKNSEQWQKNGGQFIPLPTTWLNQGRWKDEESSNEYVSINQRLGAI